MPAFREEVITISHPRVIETLTNRLGASREEQRIFFWGEGGTVCSNIRTPKPRTAIQGRYLPLLQRATTTGIKTSTLNGIASSKSRASICYVDAEFKKTQCAFLKGCGKGELASNVKDLNPASGYGDMRSRCCYSCSMRSPRIRANCSRCILLNRLSF